MQCKMLLEDAVADERKYITKGALLIPEKLLLESELVEDPLYPMEP